MEEGIVSCVPSATESNSVQVHMNSASFAYYLNIPFLFSASSEVFIEGENRCINETDILYTKIDTLINFNYKLKRAFEVKITKTGDEVLGEIEELELYSFGNNEFETLRELNQNLTEMYEYLSSKNDANLGKFPLNWKRILSSHISNQ
ncbi:MAG: hypothetical protein KKD05_10810 [Candidatus Omnitrophica bacterium]|nr:hypothetical protein [Candidatus Omnitrophota bacterium]